MFHVSQRFFEEFSPCNSVLKRDHLLQVMKISLHFSKDIFVIWINRKSDLIEVPYNYQFQYSSSYSQNLKTWKNRIITKKQLFPDIDVVFITWRHVKIAFQGSMLKKCLIYPGILQLLWDSHQSFSIDESRKILIDAFLKKTLHAGFT